MAIPVHIAGGEKFWGIYRFFQRNEALAGPPVATQLTPIRLVDDGGAMIPDFGVAGWEPRQMVLYLDGLRKRPLS
jgi:hypothetical protein